MAGLYATPGDRKAQADTTSVGSVLGERFENVGLNTPGQPAALVLHFNVNMITYGVGLERDQGAVLRELEGVLQQVANRSKKQGAVSHHSHIGIDGPGRELTSAGLRLKRRGKQQLGKKIGNADNLMLDRHSRRHSHLGKGLVDEGSQANKTSVQHTPHRPGKASLARFNDAKRQGCGVDMVAQLMRQKTNTLV